MLTCPTCGLQNDDSRKLCFKCKTELAPPATDELLGIPASVTAEEPQATYTRLIALTDAQEKIIKAFSLGAGCPVYFWTRATPGSGGLAAAWAIAQFAAWALAWQDHSIARKSFIVCWSIFSILSLAGVFFILATSERTRRLRWQRLPWRDFDHFRKDELLWNSLGLGCMLLYAYIWANLTLGLAAVPE